MEGAGGYKEKAAPESFRAAFSCYIVNWKFHRSGCRIRICDLLINRFQASRSHVLHRKIDYGQGRDRICLLFRASVSDTDQLKVFRYPNPFLVKRFQGTESDIV